MGKRFRWLIKDPAERRRVFADAANGMYAHSLLRRIKSDWATKVKNEKLPAQKRLENARSVLHKIRLAKRTGLSGSTIRQQCAVGEMLVRSMLHRLQQQIENPIADPKQTKPVKRGVMKRRSRTTRRKQ